MSRATMRAWPVLAAILLGASSAAAADAPTYTKDVAPILNAKCVSCHRPNQIGPMTLMSYREVRPWARAIKAKVASREMPPWQADPKVGILKFTNDPSLSDREIAAITAWVDAGSPEGTGTPPPLPRFSEGGWTHPSGRDPDFVYEFPTDIELPAGGEMPNFWLYSPLSLNEMRLVEASETRPGNFKATHHMGANLTSLPPGMKLGRGPAWPGGPVLNCECVLVPDDSASGQQSESGSDADERARRGTGGGPIAAYIPGTRADVARPGQAEVLRADLFKYVRWSLHYQATGQPERARPAIGFWWAREDESRRAVESLDLREYTSEDKPLVDRPGVVWLNRTPKRNAQVQNLNPLLDPIPPYAANWTVTGIGAFQNDVTLQSVFIHFHLRGKDVTLVLTHPDGREEILMRVPNYKFDWQFEYELVEPLAIRAGSTIKAITRFDNSTANKFNPAPSKEVYWSEQSWDDMFLVTVRYITDASVVPTSTARAAN